MVPQCYIKAWALLISCHWKDHHDPCSWPPVLCFLCNVHMRLFWSGHWRQTQGDNWESAQFFPTPARFILLLAGGGTAAAAYSKPKTNMCVGTQTACHLQHSPLPKQPQRQPGRIVYGHALRMPQGGNGLVNQWEFFLPLKIIVFRCCCAMGRITKGYSDAGPIVICCTSSIWNSFFLLGMILWCLKPMINQVWCSQFCTLPGWPERQKSSRRPRSHPVFLSSLEVGSGLAFNTHSP